MVAVKVMGIVETAATRDAVVINDRELVIRFLSTLIRVVVNIFTKIYR